MNVLWGGGGYYGSVVVMPRPRPHNRSHDNLTNPLRIASILYVYIDIGERIAGWVQDA